MPRISGNTASPSSFSWVVETLDRCVTSHKQCNHIVHTKLPTRVLDLGDSDAPLLVKLLEPKGIEARYICLSHCWGTTQTIKTTEGNISTHKQGIVFKSFPKTFQDAISFTRKLGVRYLWIDSLCIIQDSKQDWTKESANMASIYQNSFLTLAATKSSNGDGGCYSTNSSLTSDFPVITGEQSPGVYIREKLHHWNTLADGDLLSTFPLLTRGWTYQERLLAPRVLHFCEKELVWECLEDSFCECSSFKLATQPKVEHFAALQEIRANQPSEVLPAQGQGRKLKFWQKLSGKLRQSESNVAPRKSAEDLAATMDFASQPDIREEFRLYSLAEAERARQATQAARSVALMKAKWHEIVRDYSHLNLTVESDRLPAIAGLAREAASSRVGPYLAGLWDDSLRVDLLWRVDHFIPQCSEARPAPYRAPSWSWASVNGGISYLRDEFVGGHSYLDIIKAECTPIHGADCFGEISHGYLAFRGYLLRASLIYTFLDNGDLDARYYKLAMAYKDVALYADHCLCVKCLGVKNKSMKGEGGIEVFCLKVFSDARTTISLVLKPQKPNSTIFERIGIAEWSNEGTKGGFVVSISEPILEDKGLKEFMLC
jgi:Heterokaryon incompatibility protein (HET)